MSPAGTTREVTVFPTISVVAGRAKPHRVRWRVGGREKERLHATKAEARRFHAELTAAAARRELFDVRTGLRVAEVGDLSERTCLDLAVEVVRADFAALAGKSNKAIIEGLATVLPALVPAHTSAGRFDRAVIEHALHVHLNPRDDRALTAAETDALRWLTGASLRVAEVGAAHLERALDRAAVKQDGVTAVTGSTFARKRSALSKVFTYAVEKDYLAASPLRKLRRESRRRETLIRAIDPDEAGTPAEVCALLEHVRYAPYRLFFQVMFYAGLRPGEVTGLRVRDVHLPAGGRAELRVRRTKTQVEARYSAKSDGHELRAPKRRRQGTVRAVPVPHALAAVLRSAVAGKGRDEPVVVGPTGAALDLTNLDKGFSLAREKWAQGLAVRPADVQLRVPYSLRHAAATAWLQVMPPVEVASRLGNSVAVLMATYANCLPAQGEHYNERLDQLLG